MKKIIQFGLVILLAFGLTYCSGRMTTDQINHITSGEHGFMVYTFPKDISSDWHCTVWVDSKLYFYSSFHPGETYKIPIPTGGHDITYQIGAMEGIFIRKFYISYKSPDLLGIDAWTGKNYEQIKIDMKKDQVISINIQPVGEEKFSILHTILQLGLPSWMQRVKAIVEIEKEVTQEKKAPKPLFLGKIFSVNGEKIEIMRGQSELKPGNMFYIFNKKKVVGKLVVSQVFHTKASGKIITSQGQILKDMDYGRLNN